MRKRSDVMGVPASGRHYRVGNCRSRRLVVPAAGRQMRKPSGVMRLPASGRHYRAGNCRSRWLVVPAAGRRMRKRSDVMGCRPAAGTTVWGIAEAGGWSCRPLAGKCANVPTSWGAGQRPALPCGELPKPVVGSAGRWPADAETFRRHGVPASGRHYRVGNCRSRWLVVPAAGRQMRERSGVMGVPASGRHYRCAESAHGGGRGGLNQGQ